MKYYGVKSNGELQGQVFSEFDDAQEEARLCRIAGQEDAEAVEVVLLEINRKSFDVNEHKFTPCVEVIEQTLLNFREKKPVNCVQTAHLAKAASLWLLYRNTLISARKELLLYKDDAFCEHEVGICSCEYWKTLRLIDEALGGEK